MKPESAHNQLDTVHNKDSGCKNCPPKHSLWHVWANDRWNTHCEEVCGFSTLHRGRGGGRRFDSREPPGTAQITQELSGHTQDIISTVCFSNWVRQDSLRDDLPFSPDVPTGLCGAAKCGEKLCESATSNDRFRQLIGIYCIGRLVDASGQLLCYETNSPGKEVRQGEFDKLASACTRDIRRSTI